MNISEWLPMSVTQGPPLPKKFNVHWPFGKGRGIEFLPALVLNADKARANPCNCFNDPATGKDYCYVRGAIGMLTQSQQAELCVAGKQYKEQPGITGRWKRMRQ